MDGGRRGEILGDLWEGIPNLTTNERGLSNCGRACQAGKASPFATGESTLSLVPGLAGGTTVDENVDGRSTQAQSVSTGFHRLPVSHSTESNCGPLISIDFKNHWNRASKQRVGGSLRLRSGQAPPSGRASLCNASRPSSFRQKNKCHPFRRCGDPRLRSESVKAVRTPGRKAHRELADCPSTAACGILRHHANLPAVSRGTFAHAASAPSGGNAWTGAEVVRNR